MVYIRERETASNPVKARCSSRSRTRGPTRPDQSTRRRNLDRSADLDELAVRRSPAFLESLDLVDIAQRLQVRQCAVERGSVVLVGDRDPEHGHHRVTDELLDATADDSAPGRMGCSMTADRFA